MEKNSKTTNFFKIIQGGKAKAATSTKALTHKDIKEFLATFAEAILVDQERVNKLPRANFHPLYDDGMWERSREDHVGAIVELSMTVDKMPKRLLKKLTELAITCKPEAITQSLLNIISDLATGARSPWLYETAPLFFNELIKDVSRQDPSVPPTGSPMELMLRWFDYDDPIRIAKDPECEYVGMLASHIERESEKTKRALAERARLAFVETRIAMELVDCLARSRKA